MDGAAGNQGVEGIGECLDDDSTHLWHRASGLPLPPEPGASGLGRLSALLGLVHERNGVGSLTPTPAPSERRRPGNGASCSAATPRDAEYSNVRAQRLARR